VATGEYAWVLSQGMLFDEDNRGDGLKNTSNDDINLEEGSGNSNEDGIPNFMDDVSNMVASFNVANSSNNHNSGKRKSNTTFHTLSSEEKGSRMTAQLFSCLD
jgi:hypothetical protein